MLDGMGSLHLAAEIARLAALDTLTYEQQRQSASEALGIRVSVLDDEVAKVRQPRGPRDNRGDIELTEDGIALAFTRAHQDSLRYCHDTGSWFHWTGHIWRRERTKLAFTWARQVARQMLNQLGDANDRVKFSRAAVAAAVERFAQADRVFAVTSETWDPDPWLLGTPIGTVDLKTGHIRPALQTDYITRMTAVAPAETPDCPRWLKFLGEACGEDEGLIRFLQQWAGYCLTGDTREESLLFIYGPGGNGKGKFLGALQGILADYCRNAAMDSFTAAQHGDKHPTDIAMLKGSRMVCASETEEGRAWAEVRIKALTGRDKISARFMRQDFFEFTPEFKLTIIGNHKPVLHNVDDAAKRRFNMVPFLFQPPEPDKALDEKLKAEWPAILRWMIDGCIDWQMNGLVRPGVVVDATAAYFSEQDIIHQWIEDCCEVGKKHADTVASLFKSWSDYALANGEKPGSTKSFSQILIRNGCAPVKRITGTARNGRGWEGIAVKLPPAPPSFHESAADRE